MNKTVDILVKTNIGRADQVRERPASIGWFVGQTMKAFAGRADPERVLAICQEAIGASQLSRPSRGGENG